MGCIVLPVDVPRPV